MKSIQFQLGGKHYSLVLEPAIQRGIEGIVCAAGGDELFRIRYGISAELQKKWGIGQEDAAHFLQRFAKFHAQVRAAKGDLVGKDDYLFDTDFSTVKPEALVEKIEKEWQNLQA